MPGAQEIATMRRMSDPADPTVSVGVTLSVDILAHICPSTPRSLLEERLPAMQRMLDLSDASSPARAAVALSEACFESNYLRCLREEPSKASGPNFENYDPPSARARRLGNTQTGDGARFSGTDPIQMTGRGNFQKFSDATGIDAVNHPELLQFQENIGRASAWFISTNGINDAADAGDIDDASCRINVGETKAQWLAGHGGELLDATEADAYNEAHGLGPADPGRKHGIYGLHARRHAWALATEALGVP
jgi:predicted chitinase